LRSISILALFSRVLLSPLLLGRVAFYPLTSTVICSLSLLGCLAPFHPIRDYQEPSSNHLRPSDHERVEEEIERVEHEEIKTPIDRRRIHPHRSTCLSPMRDDLCNSALYGSSLIFSMTDGRRLLSGQLLTSFPTLNDSPLTSPSPLSESEPMLMGTTPTSLEIFNTNFHPNFIHPATRDGLYWIDRSSPSRYSSPPLLNSHRVDHSPPTLAQKGEMLRYFMGQITRLYPPHHLISPISDSTITWWNFIEGQRPLRRANQLLILGDSLSATSHFLSCFAEGPLALPKGSSLRATLEELRSPEAEETLTRESYAANPSATTWALFERSLFKAKRGFGRRRHAEASPWPPHLSTLSLYLSANRFLLSRALRRPILRELYENAGRFAFVQFGTNDLNYHRGLTRFTESLIKICETLIKDGVIPMLITIPPRRAEINDRALVKSFNFVIRALATAFRLPLIDLYKALTTLKKSGLREDHIHLNAYKGGCYLKNKGLRFGHNMKNYVALTGLTQVKRALSAKTAPWRPLSRLDFSSRAPKEPSTQTHPFVWVGSAALERAFKTERLGRCDRQRKTALNTARRGLIIPIKLEKSARLQSLFYTVRGERRRVYIEMSPSGEASRSTAGSSTRRPRASSRCVTLRDGVESIWLPAGSHQLIIETSSTLISAEEAIYLLALDFKR
jgi:hypothetical protein